MPVRVQIEVNDKLYVRDPEQTELGRKIVSQGIVLINDLGFDAFTFKKLATKIDSTEASVYRYFKSKHHLLQYLVSWYWNWLHFIIEYKTNNIDDSRRKLDMAIEILTESDKDDPATSHIDESTLHKIIVGEAARVYLTKQDKSIKAKDLFQGYDQLLELIGSYIKGVSPRYKYINQLVSTIISSVHKQAFFSDNFAGTARFKGKKGDRKEIIKFLNHFVYSCIDP